MTRGGPLLVGLLLQLAAAMVVAGQAPALNAPPMLPTDSAAYGDAGFRLGVLLQVRADIPGDARSTFFLRKAEVAIQARVAPSTHLSVELDPVNPDDPFRRTYLRLSHVPWLHVKLGMEKAPFGLEELLSSARIPFVDRSEVSDRFAAAEEVGVHLESRWHRWLAQLSVTNGGRRLMRDDNDHKDLAGRIVWAARPDVSVGAAALTGRVGPAEIVRRRFAAEVRVGPADSGLQGEYFRARDGDVRSHAFYVSGFRAIGIGTGGDTYVQPVARYERLERDDDLVAEELDLLTVGASLLIDGHRSKLQVNYLWDMRPGFDEAGLRLQYQVEF